MQFAHSEASEVSLLKKKKKTSIFSICFQQNQYKLKHEIHGIYFRMLSTE